MKKENNDERHFAVTRTLFRGASIENEEVETVKINLINEFVVQTKQALER